MCQTNFFSNLLTVSPPTDDSNAYASPDDQAYAEQESGSCAGEEAISTLEDDETDVYGRRRVRNLPLIRDIRGHLKHSLSQKRLSTELTKVVLGALGFVAQPDKVTI